jgi:hypothetical protein
MAEDVKASAGPARLPAAPQLMPVGGLDSAQLATAIVAAQTALHDRQSSQQPTVGLDKTIVGGKYLVEGVLVDAYGHPVKEHV